MLTHARNPYLEDTLSQKLYGCPRTYRVQLDSDTTDFAINKINERNFFPRDVTLKDIGLLVGAPKDSQLAFTYFSPISENGRDTFLITASYELVTPLETHDDISYLRNTCTLSRGFDKWTDAYKDLTCSIERIEISHSIKGHPYSLDGITQNGVGSRVLALQVEALRYFGVTEIKAKGLASEQGAPRMGYYALPRLGFDGKIPKWLIPAVKSGGKNSERLLIFNLILALTQFLQEQCKIIKLKKGFYYLHFSTELNLYTSIQS